MRIRHFDILKILFLSLVIVMESPALAQLEVVTNPKTITVNATRRESLTRTITLRTSERINNFKVATLIMIMR